MRKIQYINQISPFQLTEEQEREYTLQIQEAAFRPGKSKEMVSKIASLLTKRSGIKVSISTLPIPYENRYGKFLGYFGFVGANQAMRMNFLLNGKDQMYSIDMYDNALDTVPSRTIMLDGYNIVEVLDLIVDQITGNYLEYMDPRLVASSDKEEPNLTEARISVQQMMSQYLTDNSTVIQDVESGRSDYRAIGDDFLLYIQREFNSSKSSMSLNATQYYIKKAMVELGKAHQKVPGISVQPAAPTETLIDDPEAAAIFADAMNPPPAEIMQDMEDTIRQIARGNQFYTGALIYGKAGVGKTHTIEAVFMDEGVPYVKIDLPVGGYTGFMWVLYKNKDDEIIIFDDNDSIFEDDKAVNMLKKALERRPVRTFNVHKDIKVRGTDDVVPEGSFNFTSKIVFISNKQKMDAAIVSRLTGAVYALNFTNEQVYELIKGNLTNVWAEYDEVTQEMKEDVLDFVRKILPAIKDIDYRRFEAILARRLAAEKHGDMSKWKKQAVQILTTSPKV